MSKKETVSRSKLTVSTNYGGIWVNSYQFLKPEFNSSQNVQSFFFL